jgi:hypothetical protein
MTEFMKKFAPHFITFMVFTVLAAVTGHVGGVGYMVLTAYLTGAYASKRVIKFFSDKL